MSTRDTIMSELVHNICRRGPLSEGTRRLGVILKDLDEKLFKTETVWTQEEFVEAWDHLKSPLAKALTDPLEYCRNLSVELWKKFLNILPINGRNIVHLIPILSRRLSGQELQEPSEEVRLNCVILVRLVVSKYKEHLAPYTDDLVAILARTVTDNYPEVKRESSAGIEEVANAVPVQFHPRSESLVEPILSNFSHQRWKVRVASVRAIGQVLLHGKGNLIERVSTPLAQRLFDQSAAVRLAVVEVAGLWFVELRDRYSYWYKLIPLLATGLHDEIKDIRVRAGQLWDEAGKVYLQENENDPKLKDKIDFLADVQRRPPLNADIYKRPNLGCRVIVQQNVGKLVGGISRELGDWLVDVRIRTAQLLCVLVLNAEQDITQHLGNLLPAMYRACNDEDQRVVSSVTTAASYMGYFVLPSIYCPLILPDLEEHTTPGHLRVFASMVGTSRSFDLSVELPVIARWLRHPDVREVTKLEQQVALLDTCDNIITVCKENCALIAKELYLIIFTVVSTCQDESSVERAEGILQNLARKTREEYHRVDNRDYEASDMTEVYVYFLPPILEYMKGGCQYWSKNSVDFCMFCAALTRAPETSKRYAKDVLEIVTVAMNEKANPEIRLKLFILLSAFFAANVNIIGRSLCAKVIRIQKIGFEVMRDVVLPALVWSAGRTAEALRTAAACLLCTLLEGNAVSVRNDPATMMDVTVPSCIQEHPMMKGMRTYSREDFVKIIPTVVSLADDNARKTRLYALRAICWLSAIGKELSYIEEEQVHATYPTVLKRLDDGCDDVRAAAALALLHVWRARPENYNIVFSKSHIDYLYTTGIVHLDDPDPKFQQLMLDTLMDLAKIHPQMLSSKIRNCMDNFRNQEGLMKLRNTCDDLLRSAK